MRLSWKNLGKFREIFQNVSRNTAEILEKYFKNFENYCGEFGELFLKIIFKNYIGNVRKSYQKISEYFGHF